MRIRVAAVLALVGALGILASCSGGSSTSTTTSPPSTSTSSVATSPTTAPSPTTTLVEVTAPDWFSTPSGNISCAMRADWVRCDIVQRAWNPPTKPTSCILDWGPAVGLDRSGPARFLCVSDTVYRPEVTVAYGTRVRQGAMSCDVTTDGVTCRDDAGHGFSLSREAYRLT